MLGLRTNESDKFVKYFEIVQTTAQQQGCVYYLDAGDGRDFENEVYECEDLMGWLIPMDSVTDFEKEWNSDDVSDEWSEFYMWAIWSTPESPTIKFEDFSAMIYQYITLREKPEIMQKAAVWFSQKWRVPTEAYRSCMSDYLQGKTELGWYLCLDGEKIIGGLGVIENDFHDRPDLTPNICAVYTEEAYREQGIAGRLLHMAVEDLRKKGISPVYLLTDHTGFYERYGWEFLCMAHGDGESTPSRMYVHR